MSALSKFKRFIFIDREFSREIQDVRETILKGVLYVCAGIGLPTSFIGSIDAFRQGQWHFGITYIIVYMMLPASILFSRHIHYNIRAFVPILVHYLIPLSVLMRIGLSGIGSELLIAGSVIAAMLYGLRFGLATMAVGAATFAAVGVLMIHGIIPINTAAMLNSTSASSWITTIMIFILETSILALSPFLFQRKLNESMEQYRHLVTYAPAGICEIDLSTGKFSFVNNVITTYTGYTREELISMNPAKLFPDKGVLPYLERLGQLVEGNEPTVPAEYRITSKDGKILDVLVHPRYTYRDRRVVKAMFVIHNISERKKWERELMSSLKEKEILLKEIHHRVKNNMQVISSLLSLQANYIHDARDVKMFTNTQSRVRSMAAVHEKLHQSENFTSIDMGEFIKSLLAQVTALTAAPSGEIEVKVDIINIFFTLEKAVPCTLIINELVTNAFEHAFPGGRKGTVSVSLREPARGAYGLVVEDDGVGMPENFNPAGTETLGIKLIQALAEQLKGTIAFRRGRGSRCVITF